MMHQHFVWLDLLSRLLGYVQTAGFTPVFISITAADRMGIWKPRDIT